MRFEELERNSCRHQSMDELQKEQYYLNRILHELEGKIKGGRRVSFQRPSKQANSVLILPKVSSSLPRDKENDDGHRYRLQRGEKQHTLDCSQTGSRVSEVPSLPEMAHLQAEYAHLTTELSSLTGVSSTFMEGSIT
jgi:hypothetical protein